jgi:hypothetical protein
MTGQPLPPRPRSASCKSRGENHKGSPRFTLAVHITWCVLRQAKPLGGWPLLVPDYYLGCCRMTSSGPNRPWFLPPTSRTHVHSRPLTVPVFLALLLARYALSVSKVWPQHPYHSWSRHTSTIIKRVFRIILNAAVCNAISAHLGMKMFAPYHLSIPPVTLPLSQAPIADNHRASTPSGYHVLLKPMHEGTVRACAAPIYIHSNMIA